MAALCGTHPHLSTQVPPQAKNDRFFCILWGLLQMWILLVSVCSALPHPLLSNLSLCRPFDSTNAHALETVHDSPPLLTLFPSKLPQHEDWMEQWFCEGLKTTLSQRLPKRLGKTDCAHFVGQLVLSWFTIAWWALRTLAIDFLSPPQPKFTFNLTCGWEWVTGYPKRKSWYDMTLIGTCNLCTTTRDGTSDFDSARLRDWWRPCGVWLIFIGLHNAYIAFWRNWSIQDTARALLVLPMFHPARACRPYFSLQASKSDEHPIPDLGWESSCSGFFCFIVRRAMSFKS